MIKVGITGQSGFIGTHLYNSIGLFVDEFERIEFNKAWFDDSSMLDNFVGSCDVVVHLAALNRHNDPQAIYDKNIELIEKLIGSMERQKVSPHVLFSSSTQEINENTYGRSKQDGRVMIENWARNSGAVYTGMVIPNVFGPFGNPYYNSVIATFCHQLASNEVPTIEIDGELNLIYVSELVSEIISAIRSKTSNPQLIIQPTKKIKVSKVLSILQQYKDLYQGAGIIPAFADKFEFNLFNTYRCYIDTGSYFPRSFNQHTDPRGAFVEIIRLNTGGQVSFSTTVPEVTRGNHFHTRKIERFAVIKGNALIQLRRIGTDDVLNYYLSGDDPAYVDMPIWYTHNIKNIGEEDLYTIFWINEFFDANDPDTYFEIV